MKRKEKTDKRYESCGEEVFYPVAVLTIKDIAKMTVEGRGDVAKWLRRWARAVSHNNVVLGMAHQPRHPCKVVFNQGLTARYTWNVSAFNRMQRKGSKVSRLWRGEKKGNAIKTAGRTP